jgi:hypothetical protein
VGRVNRTVTVMLPPNLRLHLTRLSWTVVELAVAAAEVCCGGLSPQPPGR